MTKRERSWKDGDLCALLPTVVFTFGSNRSLLLKRGQLRMHHIHFNAAIAKAQIV